MEMKKRQCGMSLIELMVAVAILAIGMAGSAVLFSTAIGTNSRNRNDTASTQVAQVVLERLTAVPANAAATATINLTDCAGTAQTMKVGPGGAQLDGTTGLVDWTETYSHVATGYKMLYVSCGSGQGQQTTYDVRWNIQSLGGWNKIITVSARRNSGGASAMFAPPVHLRTISGIN